VTTAWPLNKANQFSNCDRNLLHYSSYYVIKSLEDASQESSLVDLRRRKIDPTGIDVASYEGTTYISY
jgi:hypothetical protein